MGWAVGYDSNWNRDIGYGVPCTCDHPECSERIDRGLAYVCCGSEPYGGEQGCGLYFCGQHLAHYREAGGTWSKAMCERCAEGQEPFAPKPDIREWVEHKLTCPTWQQWRDENPAEVENIRTALNASATADRPSSAVNTEVPKPIAIGDEGEMG